MEVTSDGWQATSEIPDKRQVKMLQGIFEHHGISYQMHGDSIFIRRRDMDNRDLMSTCATYLEYQLKHT